MARAPWKRRLSCFACGREIVTFKGHHECPYCEADNRQIDHRGRKAKCSRTAKAFRMDEYSDVAINFIAERGEPDDRDMRETLIGIEDSIGRELLGPFTREEYWF